MKDGQPGALGGSTIRVWPVHRAAWFPLHGLPLWAPDGPRLSPAVGSEKEDRRTRVTLLLGEERKSTLTSYENPCFACLHNELELTGSVEELCSLARRSSRIFGRRLPRRPIFLPCLLVALQA